MSESTFPAVYLVEPGRPAPSSAPTGRLVYCHAAAVSEAFERDKPLVCLALAVTPSTLDEAEAREESERSRLQRRIAAAFGKGVLQPGRLAVYDGATFFRSGVPVSPWKRYFVPSEKRREPSEGRVLRRYREGLVEAARALADLSAAEAEYATRLSEYASALAEYRRNTPPYKRDRTPGPMPPSPPPRPLSDGEWLVARNPPILLPDDRLVSRTPARLDLAVYPLALSGWRVWYAGTWYEPVVEEGADPTSAEEVVDTSTGEIVYNHLNDSVTA